MDLLWPEPCAICRCPVIHAGLDIQSLHNARGAYPVCSTCLAALKPIPEPRCAVCGKELISERDVCMRCRKRSYDFRCHVSLFAYRDAVRELVHAYKFDKRYSLAGFFAANLWETWKRRFSPAPVVTVPPRARSPVLRQLSTQRFPYFAPSRRDHVDRIATILQRRYYVPVLRLLQRSPGMPQKTLDYEGRMSNLKGKFVVIDTASIPLNCELILLDDVYTTGATINECAGVLLKNGAKSVSGLTIAID